MKTYCFFLIIILGFSCGEQKNEIEIEFKKFDGIPIIRLDQEAISGIGLKPVKNNDQPERRLFQKQLVRGTDLSVYVVSSETATAQQYNYGMEEFIKLVNGRSRMNPVNGNEVIFETGDSFIAPKGFTGEWETIGGDEFLIELSVISTQRVDGEIDKSETLPYLIDKELRSGVSLKDVKENSNSEVIYEFYNGIELTLSFINNKPKSVEIIKPMQEQVVEVLSGKITITPSSGKPEIFLSGDYYMIPKGFIGTFNYEGHGMVRTMHIFKSDT